MSATLKDTSCTMQLKMATGEDDKGDLIWAKRSVNYINPSITTEDFASVAGALVATLDDTLGSVFKVTSEEYEIA